MTPDGNMLMQEETKRTRKDKYSLVHEYCLFISIISFVNHVIILYMRIFQHKFKFVSENQ